MDNSTRFRWGGSVSNENLEHDLDRGPEAIKKALIEWRTATHNRKKQEGLLFANFKGQALLEGKEISATEIKHLTICDPKMADLIIAEIEAEAEYQRVYEKHLGNKRKAGIRTAY